jgi:hypothetical protein
MNKKIIIICTVGVLLLTSLAVLAYVNYTKTINYYLDSMKSLSIKNGWSTEDDFNGCNQEKESCLRFAVATIRAGSTNKLSEINAWSDYFDQRQSKIEASLANKDYKEMLKETNSYIEEVNRTYNEKKPKEKALKKEIDEVLAKSPLKGKYTITKYKIENEWVAAEIVPTVKNNDKAFVVLKDIL